MSNQSKAFFDSFTREFVRQYDDDPMFVERVEVWTRHIHKFLEHLPESSLCLDMGCGEGIFSRTIARQGHRCIGFDQSEKMIKLATANAEAEKLDGLTEYRVAGIPVEESALEGEAGLLVCSSVLEYIDALDPVVRSFRRFLKPGGIALISLPNRLSKYRKYEQWARRLSWSRKSYLLVQKHQFEEPEARALFERHGFSCLESEYYGIPPRGWLFGKENGPNVSTMFLLSLQNNDAR